MQYVGGGKALSCFGADVLVRIGRVLLHRYTEARSKAASTMGSINCRPGRSLARTASRISRWEGWTIRPSHRHLQDTSGMEWEVVPQFDNPHLFDAPSQAACSAPCRCQGSPEPSPDTPG